MSAPTPSVRAAVYSRDGYRCVRCGARQNLSFQHRRAVGMGGSRLRPEVCDGVVACMSCNARFESDLQAEALEFGWKVRSWVREPEAVPVYDLYAGRWYRLVFDGTRVGITRDAALDMMRAVYGSAVAS